MQPRGDFLKPLEAVTSKGTEMPSEVMPSITLPSYMYAWFDVQVSFTQLPKWEQ